MPVSRTSGRATRTSSRSSGRGSFRAPTPVEPEGGICRCLAFVDRPFFDVFMAGVVLVNVGLLSIETDTSSSREAWRRVNEGFLLTYLLEVALRFLRHGYKALHDRLTVMDFLLVVIAFIDRLASERSLARALPVFRLARILRRLSGFPYFRKSRSLYVLVHDGYRALMTLLWVVLILLPVLYSCATWTRVVIGESAAWNGSMDPLVDHEPFSNFDNQQYFGSVIRSLLSLLQLITLSQWADNIARPVIKVYPIIFLFFEFFIATTAYGLLMCIVSVIVQDAIVASRRVAWREKESERQQRRTVAQTVMRIFALVDENGDGELSAAEVREALATTDLEAVLKDLQVPVLEPENLIRLFDRDGDACVNLQEFVEGIVSMNEDVQPRDFVKLSIWVWNLMMKAQKLQQKLDNLQSQVVLLRRKLEFGFIAITRFQNTHEDTSLRHRAIMAIRSAPPELPPGTAAAAAAGEEEALAVLPAEAPVQPPQPQAQVQTPQAQALEDRAPEEAEALVLARPQAPPLPAGAPSPVPQPSQKRRPPKSKHLKVERLWVTVASPFVTIRDRPHAGGNHVGALKPGELLEFEDLPEGPVRPEHLPLYPYLRCWKVDAAGERSLTSTSSGFVVGYSIHSGPHFRPVEAEPTDGQAHLQADSVLSAPVTVVTPPRVQSPDGERQTAETIRKPSILPDAPSREQRQRDAEASAEVPDKYGLRGIMQNPNLTQLKELLS